MKIKKNKNIFTLQPITEPQNAKLRESIHHFCNMTSDLTLTRELQLMSRAHHTPSKHKATQHLAVQVSISSPPPPPPSSPIFLFHFLLRFFLYTSIGFAFLNQDN